MGHFLGTGHSLGKKGKICSMFLSLQVFLIVYLLIGNVSCRMRVIRRVNVCSRGLVSRGGSLFSNLEAEKGGVENGVDGVNPKRGITKGGTTKGGIPTEIQTEIQTETQTEDVLCNTKEDR